MRPKFIYKIPKTEWFIIITNTQHHFYFNSNDLNSFWQLSDIEKFYNNNIDINDNEVNENEQHISKLIENIEFNELGLLFAKSRGLDVKILDESEGDLKNQANQEIDENEEEEVEEEEEEEEFIYENKDPSTEKQTISTSVESESEKKQEESKSTGILAGYSSSEEDDIEGEEEEKEEEEEKAKPTFAQDYVEIEDLVSKILDQEQTDEESSDDGNDDNSLDLSLDDNDDEKTNDINEEFKQILNQYSDEISSYEPWELVEEKLNSEFLKFPSYHSINSNKQKEEIFKQWLKERDSKPNGDDENEEIDEENLSFKTFPTPTLLYKSLLQSKKDEIKSMIYPNFYTKNYLEINDIKLTKLEKEENFRNFKIFLNEFSKEEKTYKKQNPLFKDNYKVFKLNEFLKNQNLTLTTQFEVDSNLSFFENWINLLNNLNGLDESIVEDNINFIVGDEKRLNSYLLNIK
ncbi:uncharacterized protein KGF55_004240 [Candida pseudojiufengensis]|uniref:uncharacterized protein n=1 Tax=Candida pseudojiufengensis TaxID=497109 RepID=UPI0022250D80|nr:uncharacterized protein KGF55_004240 [Candida pseudojiufengensis]KAI5960973.1 hypothetical protein KGF55_004240 [Candida pseudojiufengensis]